MVQNQQLPEHYLDTDIAKNIHQLILTLLDGVESLPDHADNRSASHEGEERREELLLGEVTVMSPQQLLGGASHLQCDQLVASLLKPAGTASVVGFREDNGMQGMNNTF